MNRNYCEVDIFAEEFISFEGIKYLVNYLKIFARNKRTYCLLVLSKIFELESSLLYIKQKKVIIDTLYEILMTSGTE